MIHSATCTACGNSMRTIYEVRGIPTNSCIMLESREEALAYPVGDITLGFCDACGFIRNTSFDPMMAEYSGRYEETQSFSETFNAFHQELVDTLIERWDLHGKRIIEIGCGKGEFLSLLCQAGGNTGTGFDPGFDPERGIGQCEEIEFVQDFYTERTCTKPADFVACKMTLEHIRDVAEFVRSMKHAMSNRYKSTLFVQVPESRRIISECAFEDIYYEHCSYFTPGSIARLFRRLELDVLNLEVTYGDQYLTVEAGNRAAGDRSMELEESLGELRCEVENFSTRCTEKINEWTELLASYRERGPIAIWGSGSKALAFLYAVEAVNGISRVVDINPHRHGFFLPGIGLKISSPDSLREDPPAAVIAMNRVYTQEIQDSLDAMGLNADLIAL